MNKTEQNRPASAGEPAEAGTLQCETIEEERAQLAREQAARAEAEAAVTRLRAVEEITGLALSLLPLEELLRELLHRIRNLLHGDVARLLLLSEDQRGLQVRAFDGLQAETPEDLLIPFGRGIAGQIAASRQPVIIDDISRVEVLSPVLRANIKSLIGAPLMVQGRVIGVVDVGTREYRHFSDDDLHLLQLVADRAALAIENARLYQQAQFERARWQVTVQSMLDPVAVADARGYIVYVNPAYQDWVGLPVERDLPPEAYPTHYHLYRPDGTPFPAADLPLQRAVHRGEEVRGVEVVLRRPDGEERIAVWNAAPLRDDGHIIGAVTVGRDVTQERRIEAERARLLAEVQSRAAELEATLTSIADGLIIYNPAGDIVRMNPAAAEILGYSPEERARPMAERLARLRAETPEGQPIPVEETPPRRALRGERVAGVVLVIHPPTGKKVWLSVSAAPIRRADGMLLGAVVTLTDITALHELQEQREDILRAVSHDLRSPLTVIQGQAQLLLRALDRAGLTGSERHSAESILTSAQRMNSMIQDLVDAARLEAGQFKLEPRPVDLRALTRDLLARLQGVLEVERVRLEAPEGLPRALADPDRLERILTNLLSNALKYSTPGTEVAIRMAQQNSEIVTSVSDHGPGVPPEELPHLFERYYRARAARGQREGLGLGLYITRMLVEAHGGRIWAESREGMGSTFSFSLPVA